MSNNKWIIRAVTPRGTFESSPEALPPEKLEEVRSFMERIASGDVAFIHLTDKKTHTEAYIPRHVLADSVVTLVEVGIFDNE